MNAYLWVFFFINIAYTANNTLYKLYTKMAVYFQNTELWSHDENALQTFICVTNYLEWHERVHNV